MAKKTERYMVIKVSIDEEVASKKDPTKTYNRVVFELPKGYKYQNFLTDNINIPLRELLEAYDIEKHISEFKKSDLVALYH